MLITHLSKAAKEKTLGSCFSFQRMVKICCYSLQKISLAVCFYGQLVKLNVLFFMIYVLSDYTLPAFNPSRENDASSQCPKAIISDLKKRHLLISGAESCSDPRMETTSNKWTAALEMGPSKNSHHFFLPSPEENGSQRSITSKPQGKSPFSKALVHPVPSTVLRMLVFQNQRLFSLTRSLLQIHCSNISF